MFERFMRLARDQRGTIAVTSAMLFTATMGFAALGIDAAAVYTDQRKAQSVADLAAIAAVSDLSKAEQLAAATIASNGLPNASFTLQYGVYTPDPAIPVSKRFMVSSKADANAARVTLNSTTPLFFSKIIVGQDQFEVKTIATAARSSFGSFAIGSRLLTIDGGLLNQVLGSMLGTTLHLSAMDYEALVAAKLDAFDFMSTLATRLDMTAGTYEMVLSTDAKVGDVVTAMADTGKQQYGPLNKAVLALNNIAQAVKTSSEKVGVASVVDLGPYSTLPVGQKPQVSAALSAQDMLTAVAQLSNGENQVTVALNAGVPGIAAATLKLAIGERPQGTSWTTFGPAGATVHTAQTRLMLNMKVAGTGAYSVVNVPLYVEIASGTAKLDALSCGFPNVSTSTATLGVTPGVIDAWIADVPGSQFTNFSSAPNPPAATLVDVALLKVTGKARAAVSNMAATKVNFNYIDIVQRTKKTVGTTNFSASLISGLLRDTQLDVTVGGIGLGGAVVSSAIATILTNAATPVDKLVSSILQTLGIGLGQADVWMQGIRCDGAVLVS